MSSSPSSTLPIRTPDLELQQTAEGGWRMISMGAHWRSSLLPLPQQLITLATEAKGQALPLRNVYLRFEIDGVARDFRVEVVNAGLSEDYRFSRVFFYFQPVLSTSDTDGHYHQLVGRSMAMREVYRKIALYAASDAALVITGETGTGKELVARAIHAESTRSRQPYITLNCSAIAESLLESELFGHDKGAFTGAVRNYRGRFERADRGTLFLDEIGDMPLHTQTRLLRVIEERCVEPLGSERVVPVDVRIICATNVGLEHAVGQNHFRSDLYHRISVLRIHLPPLRERLEDIPLLVADFLAQLSERYQRHVERLTPEAMGLLQAYLWPGNVRELKNVIERVFVENHADVIGARAFTEWIGERRNFITSAEDEERPTATLMLPYQPEIQPARSQALTQQDIRRAYKACDGNLSAAARSLGIHRATLYRHLARLGLGRDDL